MNRRMTSQSACITEQPDCITERPDCITEQPDCITERPDQAGFSFIEVLIALSILLVGSLSILSLFAVGVDHMVQRRIEQRTLEAIKALDFFVAIDVLPQEHIAWADVVLPEATYLERYEDLWTVPHKTPYIAM
ncbi:MAG: molybdopterin-dependent oxidoreductase, partial [bacterium]|nr:molybdopterin-dependent oxidoreductase [bacterium]